MWTAGLERSCGARAGRPAMRASLDGPWRGRSYPEGHCAWRDTEPAQDPKIELTLTTASGPDCFSSSKPFAPSPRSLLCCMHAGRPRQPRPSRLYWTPRSGRNRPRYSRRGDADEPPRHAGGGGRGESSCWLARPPVHHGRGAVGRRRNSWLADAPRADAPGFRQLSVPHTWTFVSRWQRQGPGRLRDVELPGSAPEQRLSDAGIDAAAIVTAGTAAARGAEPYCV